MARSRDWRDVRAEALTTGRITEQGVAEARHRHDEQVRAWQVRLAHRARQEDVAADFGDEKLTLD